MMLRLLAAAVDDLVANLVRLVAVAEAIRPGRRVPDRWAAAWAESIVEVGRSAGRSDDEVVDAVRSAVAHPLAALAWGPEVVDVLDGAPVERWPCCVHCVGEFIGTRGAGTCPAADLHLEPCAELVAYPGTGDPRPQPCQGIRR